MKKDGICSCKRRDLFPREVTPVDTLYLKIDQNVGVHDQKVYLKDIAQISCANREIENKVKVMALPDAVGPRPGRYTKSVMEVIARIHQEMPNLEINSVGESDFIITYEKPSPKNSAAAWCKTAAVCVLSFFGAAFSIMTFNNDVDVTGLFGQLYQLFTGRASDGFTVLELAYSFGLGIGIIVFFNHFAGKKLTADPTPLEVQMRTYEDDVNKTILEASRHKPASEKQAGPNRSVTEKRTRPNRLAAEKPSEQNRSASEKQAGKNRLATEKPSEQNRSAAEKQTERNGKGGGAG